MRHEELGPTFTPTWYRVAPTRPRLSPHAHVIRQDYGGTIGYIVEEPAGSQFYRLSEPAYVFIGLLDGERTVQDAWDACCAQLGDDAPTQHECMELLAKLQMFGLLLGDLPLAPDMVAERRRQLARRRFKRRTGGGLFPHIPLFNPAPLLERTLHLYAWMWTRAGLAAWSVVVGVALVLLATDFRRLASTVAIESLLAPGNLVVLGVTFLVLRALHEFGHAASCRALGGRCTEIGVILIAWVLPIPYCDATSSWRFAETWRRVVVALGGVLVETFAAAIATIVWAFSSSELVDALAVNVMLISGVSTLVFNLNPLLRYDGYYILSDLTGTPNLAQRARESWRYLVERFAFGVRSVRAPNVRGRGESALLLSFGAVSTPYRLLVGVAIVLLISSRYLTIGLVIAGVVAMIWFVWPVLKGLTYLLTSPRLVGRRARAATLVAGVLGGATAVLGLVPVSAAGYATGLVEPREMSALRAGESGFVRAIHARAGDLVEAGQPVFVLENPQLQAELAGASARVDAAHASLDAAMARDAPEQSLARARLDQALAEHARLARAIDALTVRATTSGRLLPAAADAPILENLRGLFVARGTLLAIVATTDDLVVRASVTDADQAYLFRPRAHAARDWPVVTVRFRGRAWDEIPGEVVRREPAGTRSLDPRLSTRAAGEIAPDPRDAEGKRSLHPTFTLDVRPAAVPEGVLPGRRARVRLGVPPEPVLTQAWRWLSRELDARLLR